MTATEQQKKDLLDRALTTLICALAHDAAVAHTTDISELPYLREQWVPDAERIVDEAERLGLLDDGLDDEDDFDDEELDDEEDDWHE